MKRAFIVGGAGFIGSHLVDAWQSRGPITVFDNFSVGKRAFLASATERGSLTVIEGDALELETLTRAMDGHDVVFHLSANPEARVGLKNTRFDLEQGTVATYNVLEAMRTTGVGKLVFASSGTVYGDVATECAEGDLGALPISLYGAAKLAGEAMISAFVECFGLSATIFRFGNVVGPRGTHGAALDFLNKLKTHRTHLEVLGDGRQAKPYLHVDDCVGGLLFGADRMTDPGLNVFNLAPADVTTVMRIAELCVAASPYPDAEIRTTGGERGWPGDVPRSRMRPDLLADAGYRVSRTSDQAVSQAVQALATEVFGG